MTLRWRPAVRADVPAVVALLADDALGQGREDPELAPYLAAFDAMQAEAGNQLIVAEIAGRVVATYQFTVISGLSLKATRRAQIESLRVASDLRGQGLGAALLRDAEARARASGCGLLQLTSNAVRSRAHGFYERVGYVPSHVGFKRVLE
jgi:GNAT superfamily N-acetyltransferase